MANKYWVNGTGNWSNTARWSTSSGGSSGASVPTSSDDVFIDENSGFGGGGTITIDNYEMAICNDLTCTSGHTFTIDDGEIEADLSIYGSLTLESGITFSGFIYLQFLATTSGKFITTVGVLLPIIYFYGVGGWTLLDELSTTYFEINTGTFDANDFNVISNKVVFDGDATIYMGSGTWEITGDINAFMADDSLDITIIPESSTIKMISPNNTQAVQFWGGDYTYNNIWFVGTNTENPGDIHNSNTFNDLRIDVGGVVMFTAGTTQIISTLTAIGSAGNLITLYSSDSITPVQFTLSKSSDTVSCDYLDLSNSNATGGATWYAGSHSVDSGNNDGWIFKTLSPFPSHFNI